MSHYDERGLGQSRAGQNPLADFDALRARRIAEQEADGYEATAPIQVSAYDQGYGYDDGAEPTRLVGGLTPPPAGRGKLRSTVVFVGMVLFVVGLGAGVYAATRPSGGTQATAAVPPAMAPSPGASSGAGAGNPGMASATDAAPNMGSGPGSGMDTGAGGDGSSAQPSQMPKTTARGTLTMLTVVDVGSTSFTATTTRGATVTVQVTSQTQFGTQAQPFSRSDLVPGAVVWARIRRDPDGDGDLQATLIAGIGMNDPATQASPTGDGGNGGNGDSGN